MSETAEEIGTHVGERFKTSTIDQLNAILAKLNIRTADLGGSTSSYGSRVGGYGQGVGRAGGRAGSSRSIGGGHTWHAADKPYRGEPVLDEGVAADTDA